ncbi:GNAT family N-acetyltransferase [Synechococcus moorigangaii CMS01]|nr:GNAT family N-acetyltransferase [Synechococcus moorigangaii CMS01]
MDQSITQKIFMGNILRYDKQHESALLFLLINESDWQTFTNEQNLKIFKEALLTSETFICEHNHEICGYLRALVDAFGLYVSELYVAPSYRNQGHGKKLLQRLKKEHPQKNLYVLSDEDLYYQKLGLKQVGSVFQL